MRVLPFDPLPPVAVDLKHPVPRSAYIHVPFCAHRCGYCNFSLVTDRDDLIDQYLRALEVELRWLIEPREVDTLFLGGGTPSYLLPNKLEKLLQLVKCWFPLAAGAEFTIEANPKDLLTGHEHLLISSGVTRVSLGAQSFNTSKLQALERDHSAGEINKAVEILQTLGVILSLDLIFGAPQETVEIWHQDLTAVLALNPDHISTYGLTFEKGTLFYNRLLHGNLNPVDESVELAMYELAIDRLTAAGFTHYEVSSFARDGQRCLHNEGYWTQRSYFAAGPGAARFINGVRETNHRSTTTYIKRLLAGSSPIAFRERLSPESAAREQAVFGLRRLEGIVLDAFRQRTGFDLSQLLGNSLEYFIDQDLFSLKSGRLKLTRKGLLVSDCLWPKFLTE
jgi:oxygen-independent coproporphyrinogen-3 oxidase